MQFLNGFPTMKRSFYTFFSFCFFLSISLATSVVYGQEITTYYLIRHAEKDLSDKSNPNPHLTNIGRERAEEWKDYFKEVAFDLIYSTNYHRTMETATPIAKDHQLFIKEYNPNELYTGDFKKETQGKTVLVVGHSNTTPALANKIKGQNTFESIDEKIHGNLYLLQVFEDNVSCQLLSLE